jgi:hypothetical protein
MIKVNLSTLSAVTFYFPADESIKHAYLKYANKNINKSFILYYLEKLFGDIKNGTHDAEQLEGLIHYNADLIKELNEEIAELIVDEWTSYFGELDDANQQRKLKKYLTRLLRATNVDEPRAAARQLLMTLLWQAGEHAAHLAKGIYILCDADLGNDYIINFLVSHPANADYLAELIILFHQGFNVDIDDSLLALLATYEDKAQKFYICVETEEALNRLMDLVDTDVLNFENMKALFEHVDHITEIMIALTDLYVLSPELCKENAKLIIENSDVPHLLDSIKTIIERHRAIDNPLIDPENELAELMRADVVEKSLTTYALTHGIFARREAVKSQDADLMSTFGMDKQS